MSWHGGPYSKDFPERIAAQMVHDGILRVDPDGSVWRLRRLSKEGDGATYDQRPKRIDYGPPGGHRMFEIRIGEVGQRRSVKVQVARLVWQVHKGDIPPKLTVNHKDGRPDRNVIDNFELATHSEQHLHRYKVLGQKAPGKVNKHLAAVLAEGARTALTTGDLEPLRAALKEYDERPYGKMARYRDAAIRRKEPPGV